MCKESSSYKLKDKEEDSEIETEDECMKDVTQGIKGWRKKKKWEDSKSYTTLHCMRWVYIILMKWWYTRSKNSGDESEQGEDYESNEEESNGTMDSNTALDMQVD